MTRPKRNLPAKKKTTSLAKKQKFVIIEHENILTGKKTRKRIPVPEKYTGKITAFKRAYIKTAAEHGGFASAVRGEEWARKFVLTRSKAAVRNKKFFSLRASNNALTALLGIHSKGKTFKKYDGWSEDYDHPDIGEIAIPAKGKVVFKRKFLEAGEINQKTRAKDVGYLIYSINKPYCIEKHGFDFMQKFSPPQYPINAEKFAKEYAKRAGIENVSEFTKQVKLAVDDFNYSHWDHPADHI